MGKRKAGTEKPKNEEEYDLPGKHTKMLHVRPNEKRLYIVLEKAHLETVKVSVNLNIKSCNFSIIIIFYRLVIHSNC